MSKPEPEEAATILADKIEMMYADEYRTDHRDGIARLCYAALRDSADLAAGAALCDYTAMKEACEQAEAERSQARQGEAKLQAKLEKRRRLTHVLELKHEKLLVAYRERLAKLDKAEARIAQLRGAINNVLSTATGNQWRDVLHEALRRDDEKRLGDGKKIRMSD